MLNIIWIKMKAYRNSWPMIVIMTVMALALTFVFGKGFDSGYIPSVAIADNDGTKISNEYMQQLMNDKGYTYTQTTLEEGIEGVEGGTYMAVVEIESGFAQGLANNTSKVTLYKSGNAIEHQNLAMSIQNSGRLYVYNQQYVDGLKQVITPLDIDISHRDLLSEIAQKKKDYPLLTIQTRQLDGEGSNGYDSMRHSFIGFLLFFSMFTMVFSIGGIVEEKENSVWYRQQVAPIGKVKIMLGNIIASFIGGMIQLIIMIVVSKYAFAIDFGGNIVLMLIVLSFYVIAITALGLVLSTFVKTSQQLGSFSPVIIVGTSMIGGCMWPLSIIQSKVLLFLADLTPQRWAYSGLERIIIDHGQVGDILLQIAYLSLIACVLFAIALIKFRMNDD